MLGLNIGLMSDLGTRLGLMPGLDVGLGCGCKFSVVNRRPVDRARSDIRVWGWNLRLGSGYPDTN